MITRHGGYEVDDDPARVDRDVVWSFLSADAYWATWRARDDVERQLDNAWRVTAAYDRTGSLVGFARAFSDGVSSAYLADVFVLPPHRGRGVAAALVRLMIDEGPGARFRWMLHTADAHGLYEKFGFGRPDETALERPANRE